MGQQLFTLPTSMCMYLTMVKTVLLCTISQVFLSPHLGSLVLGRENCTVHAVSPVAPMGLYMCVIFATVESKHFECIIIFCVCYLSVYNYVVYSMIIDRSNHVRPAICLPPPPSNIAMEWNYSIIHHKREREAQQ